MWILESNGDFLQGKRMWLKPGKKYLFGRVKKDGVRFAIDHKTVSRKHFVITVDPVRDQDVGQVHARSKITITDENSKAGTNIDGKLIKNSSQELKNTINSIRPGSCPHELVITWQPCVMTFMLNKKELKNGDLKTKQERVKDLDIKAVSDYLTEQTTHLVAQKRNTAKCLQALIEGKPILTEAYVDALIYASTPIDLQEDENLCPLETDFDDAWPDPILHLPPRGKEPTDKAAEAYKPDPARARVFDKYTFIFFDQSQYDSLLPAITTGHGKALLFEVDVDTASLQEGYDFVKNAVGNLNRAVLVTVNESADSRPSLTDYIDQLCSKLGHGPASQSEFLETILCNDASLLQKPRTETTPPLGAKDAMKNKANTNGTRKDLVNGVTAASRHREMSTDAHVSSAPSSRANSAVPESAARKTTPNSGQQSASQDDNPRPAKRARFFPSKKPLAAFDDDFNADAIVAYEEDPSPPKVQPRSGRTQRSQATSNGASVKDEPEQAPRNARDGSLSSVNNDSDNDDMDDLLPAAATITREKTLAEAELRRKGLPVPSEDALTSIPKPKKDIKLLNVREAVRAQREVEEDNERREREELDEYNAEADSSKGPANLVKIGTLDLPVRKRTDINGLNGYKGEGWKPEWDGRKNFKGFRRARDVAAGNGDVPRRREKIIVPLVPAKRHDYGLGERYWERTQEEKAAKEKEKRRKASQRSQSQVQPQKISSSRSQRSDTVQEGSESDDDHDEPVQASDDDINGGEEDSVNPEASRLQAEAEGVLDHAIDIDEPRQTRGSGTQASAGSKSTSTSKSAKAGSKRPASKTPPSTNTTTASKRQKTLPITVVHGSDSDDGDDSDDLKFKVGRGRRARSGKM